MAGTNPALKGHSPCPPEFIQVVEKGILRDLGGGMGALPGTGAPILASRDLKADEICPVNSNMTLFIPMTWRDLGHSSYIC